MKKIKIIGFLIFLLSVLFILLFNTRSAKEQTFAKTISLINKQRSNTQEIAKTIFYAHRNKKALPGTIDSHMYSFLSNLKSPSEKKSNLVIQRLGQAFFALVNQFKYIYTDNIPYSILILDKLVNNIYKKNMELVVAFNQEIARLEKQHSHTMRMYTIIQYLLLALLIPMLLYIFTQVDEIIQFIQKFAKTSDRIIEKASIKGVAPIEIQSQNIDLYTAAGNFNSLVASIDESLKIATVTTENSINALEIVERNIELLISLVYEMQEEEREDIYKKEDAVIESLETLMGLAQHLKFLKKDLKKLV